MYGIAVGKLLFSSSFLTTWYEDILKFKLSYHIIIMIRILIILLISSFSLSADQYDSRLEKLFDKLLQTEDENEINKITISIWDIWHETNDPKISADFFR